MKRSFFLKTLTTIGFFISLLFFPNQIVAAEDWAIENFQSDIKIQDNGEVLVIETIEVDFRSLQRHGIFRQIPYIYQNANGSKYYTEIKVLEANHQYKVTTENNFVVVRLGNSKATVSGKQNYTIKYLVRGVLRNFQDYDELYWNVTGNNWEVPINKATSTVILPKGEILSATCYQGPVGSKQSCSKADKEVTQANFSAENLSAGSGLTVAVGYPAGLVPLIRVEAPQSVGEVLFTPINLAAAVAVLLVGLAAVYSLWWHKGRDFWVRKRYIDDPLAKHEAKPISASETIVVEFTPPEDLRPGEIGALQDQTADTLDITATIVDLANRGFLIVTEKNKTWLFGSKDYILKSTAKDNAGLYRYEQLLLESLFEEKPEIALSSLKNKFYKDLAKVKESLTAHLVKKGFFPESPTRVKIIYSVAAIIVLVIAAALILLGFGQRIAILISVGGALALVGAAFLIVAQFMSRRSANGREMYIRAQGYKMFIERAEKYRQQFFEKKNLFNEVLPYAIVFGVTAKFAKAFEKMGVEAQQPSWYHGSGAFHAAAFATSMNSFSTSVSSAIASSPSSSGSGGGGSSGGGFGGGGGGSW